jgi:hypothetical protein
MNWFSLKIFELRFWLLVPPVFAFVIGCSAQDEGKFNGQRVQMVERQIKARGITDEATIEACMKVPRHRFVLPQYINSAYADSPLPIEEGQTISQPYIVAFMTEALQPETHRQSSGNWHRLGLPGCYSCRNLRLCFYHRNFSKTGEKSNRTFC